MRREFGLYGGRLNRTNLGLGIVYYFLIAIVVVTLVLTGLESVHHIAVTGRLFRIISVFSDLCFLMAVCGLYARRLHDLNRPTWQFIYGLVPIINLAFIIYLLAAPGTVGTNDYGPASDSLNVLHILGFNKSNDQTIND